MTWSVEGALGEVVAWTQEGARSAVPQIRLIGTQAQSGLHDRYFEDFEYQHLKGRNWDVEKEHIRPLAQLVGLLAAQMTRVAKNDDNPQELDEACTLAAAYAVSRSVCPPYSGALRVTGLKLGEWCKRFAFP